VRSSHCVACVWSGSFTRPITNRARPQARSQRIGIALVGHRRRTDLLLLEGLLDFLLVREEADVCGALVDGACGDGERSDDLRVDEARVRLPAHR
jgi:hypothetical protein